MKPLDLLRGVLLEIADANTVEISDASVVIGRPSGGVSDVTLSFVALVNESSIRLELRASCRVKSEYGHIISVEMTAPCRLVSVDRTDILDLYNPSLPLLLNNKPNKGNEATGELQVFLDKLFIAVSGNIYGAKEDEKSSFDIQVL